MTGETGLPLEGSKDVFQRQSHRKRNYGDELPLGRRSFRRTKYIAKNS